MVGQGDQPWLKQGRVDTCGVCKGTGQIDVDGEEVAAPAEPVNAPESSAVDNAENVSFSEGSPDGSAASEGDQTAPEEPVELAEPTVSEEFANEPSPAEPAL